MTGIATVSWGRRRILIYFNVKISRIISPENISTPFRKSLYFKQKFI